MNRLHKYVRGLMLYLNMRLCDSVGLGASPSKKSIQRFKTKIGDYLVPANTAPWPEVLGRLNSMLQGWSNYFCYGTRRRQQRAVDRYVYERVRDFLVRRHKVAGRGNPAVLL
jgi:RNA-directed DNA polymerase